MKGNEAFDQLSYEGQKYLVKIHRTKKSSYVLCNADGIKRNYCNYCHDNCLCYKGTTCKQGESSYVMCSCKPKNNNYEKNNNFII